MSVDRSRALLLRVAGIAQSATITGEAEVRRDDGSRVSVGVQIETESDGDWAEATVPLPAGDIVWARVSQDGGQQGVGNHLARLSVQGPLWDDRHEAEPLIESYLGRGRTAFRSGDAYSRYSEADITSTYVSTGAGAGSTSSHWTVPRMMADRIDMILVNLQTSSTTGNRGVYVTGGATGGAGLLARITQIIPASMQPAIGFTRDASEWLVNLFQAFGPLYGGVLQQGTSMYASIDNAQSGDSITLAGIAANWRPQPTSAY